MFIKLPSLNSFIPTMSTSTEPFQTGVSNWLCSYHLKMTAATWRFQISTVLRLMEIVNATDKCPVPIINADKVANLLEINDWNCQDMKAKTQLTLI